MNNFVRAISMETVAVLDLIEPDVVLTLKRDDGDILEMEWNRTEYQYRVVRRVEDVDGWLVDALRLILGGGGVDAIEVRRVGNGVRIDRWVFSEKDGVWVRRTLWVGGEWCERAIELVREAERMGMTVIEH